MMNNRTLTGKAYWLAIIVALVLLPLTAQGQASQEKLDEVTLLKKILVLQLSQNEQKDSLIDKLATQLAQSQREVEILRQEIISLSNRLDPLPGFIYLGIRTYKCLGQSYNVKEYRHEQTGLEFVLIPEGSFKMGSENGARDEKPRREVRVNEFLLSKTEVTQAVWQQVMGSNPSKFQGKNLPVESVSWEDCQRFCNKTGLRLPFEAEWEYACRAGTHTPYYWGDKMDGKYACYNENSSEKTHPVAMKKANAFGLCDMSGNVWEWCQDWYDRDYYAKGINDNPSGPTSKSTRRVFRGGSFLFGPRWSRSSHRAAKLPIDCHCDLGLRVAASINYGLPSSVWLKCRYNHYGRWILNMSSKCWMQMSVEQQQRYVKKYQQEYARSIGQPVYKTFQSNGVKLAMCLVPPGRFTMGAPRRSDETPHQVVISEPYWLQQTEVTQAVWEKIMGNNPSQFKGGNHPVEKISWDECQQFCKKTGLRLPTEAEWEYACRAGTTTQYYWGDKMDEDYVWYKSNSNGKTHPVGEKKPNAFGLYDMSGNVWEWCQDWYEQDYYNKGENNNPTGPNTGSFRVFRGSSSFNDASYCRCALRIRNSPGFRNYSLGLRVAAQCR